MTLLFTICPAFGVRLKKQFTMEATELLKTENSESVSIAPGTDTNHLPDIVQKYIYRTNFAHSTPIKNMKVSFEGEIRKSEDDEWMKVEAFQFTSFEEPSRLVYMKAKTYSGFHSFSNGKAIMKVKNLGLFNMFHIEGESIDQTALVTYFNDLCLMAPSQLANKKIKWEEIDTLTTKATFTLNNNTISAELKFNSEGFLENFTSNDKYDFSDTEEPEKFPFSTPIKYYMEHNNLLIPQTIQTQFNKPEGEYIYGTFTVKNIEYNVTTENLTK